MPSRGRRRSRTAGSSAACSTRSPKRTPRSRPSSSTSCRWASTTSSTASCATGTSSSFKSRVADADLSATALYVLRETLSLCHPVIPFVTEELWSHVPGADGLLAGGRLPVPDEALRDQAAEAEFAQVIDAVTAIRAWRDGADIKAGERLPAALPDGLASDARSHGSRGWTSRPRATARPRSVLDPAGRSRSGAGWTPSEEARKRDAQRSELRGRDRARRGQARQRGLRGQGARRRGAGRARQARAPAHGAGGAVNLEQAERYLLGLELFGMRFGLDRMRRLMTVLGLAAGALPLDPRRRHQREVVDRAHDQRDPGAPRAAHGHLPVAAPRLVHRAHPDRGARRRRPSASPPRSRAPRGRPRRSTARSRATTA